MKALIVVLTIAAIISILYSAKKIVMLINEVKKTNIGLSRQAREERKEEFKAIKIKYFDQEIEKMQIMEKGDLIDLRAAETVELKAGEYKEIRLGVAMELPEGYKANVYPRSSTFKNYGILLVNSVGQIDNSYCGDSDEWRFPAYATRDTVINKNDRICQFEIVKIQPKIIFKNVAHLEKKARGGIGSTGIK